MTATFVDPRTEPDPRAPRPPARFAAEAGELEELHRFCREGRLYEVERWIWDGRPLQLRAGFRIDGRRQYKTAFEIALERQDQALLLLLVANGYDLAAERECPLDAALESRRRELVDLLLDWGADPGRVDLDTLCDTYDSELYERFRRLGVDLTADHTLAYALGYHTSNKPLFGFAKRHRPEDPRVQTELDIALAHHAREGNEKGVLLCLWAGADAHAPVPWLEFLHLADEEDDDEGTSAVEQACSYGHVEILERLEPDPARDDFDKLYCKAPDDKVVEVLARSALPGDASRVVMMQLAGLVYGPLRGEQPVEALRALFEAGVRWQTSSPEEIGQARRDVLRADDWNFLSVVKLLATDDYCSDEVLIELARTSAMRKRLRKLELIPATPTGRSEFDRSRPTRAREILARFGIEVRKPGGSSVCAPGRRER